MYCDYKLIKFTYTIDTNFDKCFKCNDTNLKIKNLSKKPNIDYYQGSPKFKTSWDAYGDAI